MLSQLFLYSFEVLIKLSVVVIQMMKPKCDQLADGVLWKCININVLRLKHLENNIIPIIKIVALLHRCEQYSLNGSTLISIQPEDSIVSGIQITMDWKQECNGASLYYFGRLSCVYAT